MNCNVIKDLIPLYIDECCSDESSKIVDEHIESCASCKRLMDEMKAPTEMAKAPEPPASFNRLSGWLASLMQATLMLGAFVLIAIGVALEASTPNGAMNSFWAFNVVVPSTGFLLSMANWCFLRQYKSRKSFSRFSLIITLGITLCVYAWSVFHYEIYNAIKLSEDTILFYGLGLLLTAVFCIVSGTLSNQYAKMLGKE